MVESARRTIQELSAEVATNPNSTAFVELSRAYRERGDPERALRLCLRGLERHPTHVEAHYELGCIYEAQGQRELALDEWGVVRQLAPEHLAAHCASARLYLDEQRLEDAERELLEARDIAADDPWVRELWETLQSLQRDGSGSQAGLFEEVEFEHPGTIGVLLLSADGEVLAGRVADEQVVDAEGLAEQLGGARTEADRMMSYLELGAWSGLTVESDRVRIAVVPIDGNVLAVATGPDVPAGRAARALERAREVAEAQLWGRS